MSAAIKVIFRQGAVEVIDWWFSHECVALT